MGRVVEDVGRVVMADVSGGIPEFEPFIRYHTLGNSAIIFTVILCAREIVDHYLIKHESIKRCTRASLRALRTSATQ